MSENKQQTGNYYRNIVRFLTEKLEDERSELEKNKRFWNFRMRFVLRRRMLKLVDQIHYYENLVEEYKKHGWIT